VFIALFGAHLAHHNQSVLPGKLKRDVVILQTIHFLEITLTASKGLQSMHHSGLVFPGKLKLGCLSLQPEHFYETFVFIGISNFL
jgi:hypothetical protein